MGFCEKSLKILKNFKKSLKNLKKSSKIFQNLQKSSKIFKFSPKNPRQIPPQKQMLKNCYNLVKARNNWIMPLIE